jgi:hypothetical protein
MLDIDRTQEAFLEIMACDTMSRGMLSHVTFCRTNSAWQGLTMRRLSYQIDCTFSTLNLS